MNFHSVVCSSGVVVVLIYNKIFFWFKYNIIIYFFRVFDVMHERLVLFLKFLFSQLCKARFSITIHSIQPNIFLAFSEDLRTNVSIAPATATPMCALTFSTYSSLC